VFGDSLATTFGDTEHSVDGQRFLTIGASASGRLLVVPHTEREESIRIHQRTTGGPTGEEIL
jgi:uncharacterized DUF497 family protein